MSDDGTNVMIAAYTAEEPALLDYRAVVDADVKVDGVFCVTRDRDGKISVTETERMVQKGAMKLGGFGLIAGLFAPPVLFATAVGAAVGGGVGELARRKVVRQFTLSVRTPILRAGSKRPG